MNKKKRHILRISLLTVVMLGAVIALAYFNSKDSANNIFTFGNKYTLTYHANTGDTAEDGKVTNLPEKDSKYGDGKSSVEFTVSSDKPVRPGFVFTGWYEKATPDTTTDTKYGSDGTVTYTAPADQYESNLYAQWQAGYTLIYDANGGEGTPDIQAGNTEEQISGNVVTKVSGDPTYTFTKIATQGTMTGPKHKDSVDPQKESSSNRVFLGWSTDKNATEPEYTGDGNLAYENTNGDYDKTMVSGFTKEVAIDSNTNPSKTVTLYAVWATKYELKYEKHPEMDVPAVKTITTPTQTLVSTKATHIFTIPAETDAIRPQREGGYRWGWWGDTSNRFGYDETQPTSAKVNEGCYLFGENVKALTKDAPVMTLYAYFQPPRDANVIFDKNTSGQSNTADKNATVEDMPDNKYGFVHGEIWYVPWEEGVPTNIPKHVATISGREYKNRYLFKGWAYTPNATEPDVMPGEKDFKFNVILTNEVKLYAVWESGHNYRLYFNYNGGGRTYLKKSDGSWDYYSSNEYIYYSSDDPATKEVWRDYYPANYFKESSFTWSKEFFSTRGVFATRADDSVGTYKFLGWSYKQQAPNVNPEELTVDFPVKIPSAADKTNPNPLYPDLAECTGDVGFITSDVTFDEPDATCTAPKTHDVKLYAVWQKSPKHQLALVFNKGGASTLTGTNSYYDPSSSGYVASVDLTQKTWTASDLANVGVPVKNDEDTATYEFIGWTDKADLTGGIGAESDVTVTVDPATKKVNQSVTVKEPKDNPRLCDGGRHTRNLYPVFKKTARHKFVVNYDINAPSTASTVETYLYRSDNPSDSSPVWTKEKVKGGSPVTGDINATGLLEQEFAPLSKKVYTYTLNGKGMFATCVNTSPNSTSNYTFLGWSYRKYALGEYDSTNPDHKLEFPVTAPDDPKNPGSGQGTLNADVVINEDDEDPACSEADNQGNIHPRTLHGVWSGEPLHQFAVVFVGGSGSQIVHGSADDWTNDTTVKSSESIAKGEEDFAGTGLEETGTGKLANKIDNVWRLYSDALRMPADTSDPEYSKSYTFFDTKYWQDNDMRVEAVRADSDDTRYTFNGWNTELGKSAGNVTIDPSTGRITTQITVNSDEYPCDSKTHHTVLYAAWKEEPIHNYQLLFYANGGNQLGYQDGANWRSNQTSYAPGYSYSKKKTDIVGILNDADLPDTMYYTAAVATDKDPVSAYTSHEWKATDTNPLRLEAKRANVTENGTQYRFEFEGWGEAPDGPVKYAVDASSYLTSDVKIESPEGSTGTCENHTHTKVLYAIWKKIEIPKQHRFALTFDLNGGSYFRTYNSSSGQWVNNGTRTIYDTDNGAYEDISSAKTSHTWSASDLESKGIGGATRNASTEWTYEFVGWSEEKITNMDDPTTDTNYSTKINWAHDDNSTEPGDGWVKQDITATCGDPAAHSSQQNTHTKTVYAIWKRTPRTKDYKVTFDVNAADGSGVAPTEMTATETYDNSQPAKWNTHTFDLSGTATPTNKSLVFAGWNEDSKASTGKYGNPYTGSDEDRRSLTAHLNPEYTTAPALANNVYTSEKTLYAIWLYDFTLTYNANGGSNAPPHMHAYDKDPEKTTILRDNEPSREGYTFKGWATSADATEAQYQPGQQITIRADASGKTELTLYAVWQKNE